MKLKPFFLASTCASLVALVSMSANAVSQSIDIQVEYQKNSQYQVESQYQHQGRVIVNHAGQDSEPQELSIDVNARLDYHERFVGSAEMPQAVRYFNESKAEIKVDNGTTISKLSDKNLLIVTRLKSNGFQIASVADMLQQHEMDLMKNPGDPLTFSGLLNKSDVKVGDEWEPNRDSLARFLMIDRVISSDVKLKLKDVESNMARLYMLGKLKADVDDVRTHMDVTAILIVDLNSKLVSSVRLKIVESRQPGQVAPGFEGQSKLNLQMAESQGIPQLSNDSLRAIAESKTIRNVLKWEAETGSFALQYDPSWKMIASDSEAAILRYLENGDLLAQCNIVRLSSRPPNKPMSIRDFQAEVVKVISADSVAEVIDAGERRTASGLRALHVTVRGVEKEVPLNWIYYNVAHVDGRQVTFVFTLEEAIASRVKPAAVKLVDGFVFSDVAPASELARPSAKAAARDVNAAGTKR